jgi:hypothetical protein
MPAVVRVLRQGRKPVHVFMMQMKTVKEHLHIVLTALAP